MNDEKENGLAKKESNGLAKPSDFKFELPESIGDFSIEDLRLSTLMICQALSNKAIDAGIKPGMLYDSMTFEAFDELPIIMFFKFDTRILYGDNVGDALKCYSQDAKIPSAPTPINDNCITCQENIKPPELIEKGKSKYGKCNRTFNFASIIPDLEIGDEKDFPFLVPMQRTNASIAKKIINLTFRKRQELFSIKRILSTEEVTGDKGRYYIYKVVESELISEVDIERSKYWMHFIKAMLSAQKLIIDFDKEAENSSDDVLF